jgi:hypothetical protein
MLQWIETWWQFLIPMNQSTRSTEQANSIFLCRWFSFLCWCPGPITVFWSLGEASEFLVSTLTLPRSQYVKCHVLLFGARFMTKSDITDTGMSIWTTLHKNQWTKRVLIPIFIHQKVPCFIHHLERKDISSPDQVFRGSLFLRSRSWSFSEQSPLLWISRKPDLARISFQNEMQTEPFWEFSNSRFKQSGSLETVDTTSFIRKWITPIRIEAHHWIIWELVEIPLPKSPLSFGNS